MTVLGDPGWERSSHHAQDVPRAHQAKTVRAEIHATHRDVRRPTHKRGDPECVCLGAS